MTTIFAPGSRSTTSCRWIREGRAPLLLELLSVLARSAPMDQHCDPPRLRMHWLRPANWSPPVRKKHVPLTGYIAKNLSLRPTVCGLWGDEQALGTDDEVTCEYCQGVLYGVREKIIPSAAVSEDEEKCVTHHYACDCREEALQAAIAALLDELADQGIDTVQHPARKLVTLNTAWAPPISESPWAEPESLLEK